MAILCLLATVAAAIALQVTLTPGPSVIALVIVAGGIVALIPVLGWLLVGRSLDAERRAELAAAEAGVPQEWADEPDDEPEPWPEFAGAVVPHGPAAPAGSVTTHAPVGPPEPVASPGAIGPPTRVAESPATPADLLTHAGAMRDAGDADGAEAAYREVAAGDGGLAAAASLNLGVLLAGQGDLDGAEAAYRRAVTHGGSVARSAQVLLELLEDRRR